MMSHLTTLGTIHTIAALLAITVGDVRLVRPKHGPAHRARGYAFVFGMILVDGAAMLLYLIGAVTIRRYRPPVASRDMQMMVAIHSSRTP